MNSKSVSNPAGLKAEREKMRDHPRRAVLAVVGLGSLAAASHAGASVAVISTGPYPAGSDLRDGYTHNSTFSGTVGYSFTTGTNPITVTALGYYDGPNSALANVNGYTPDGLNNSHQVAIWDATSGTQLFGTTVTPAANNVVGDFRYVTVPTQTLAANTTYIIGGEVTTADQSGSGDVFRDVGQTAPNQAYFGPGITFSQNASYSFPGFSKPTNFGTGYSGPSLLYTVPVAVVNASFSSPSVGGGFNQTSAPGSKPTFSKSITNWGVDFNNAVNEGGVGLVNDPNSGGSQAAYVNSNGNDIYQDVGTLTANTKYTLTVAVSDRVGAATGDIALLNGTDATGLVLASSSFSDTAPDGFRDLTVTFTTGAIASGDLTIKLDNSGDDSAKQQVAFGDVRISAQFVPEPASLSLMGLGSVALLVRRRSRCR